MIRLGAIFALCGIWAALHAASFLLAAQTVPDGDGFTRGMNRLSVFARYQVGSGSVAVVIWLMGQRLRQGWQRWLARVPGLLALGLILLVIGTMTLAILFD